MANHAGTRRIRAVLEGTPYPVRGLIGFGAKMLLSQADGGRGRAALAALDRVRGVFLPPGRGRPTTPPPRSTRHHRGTEPLPRYDRRNDIRTSIGQSPSRRRRGHRQVASFVVGAALLIGGCSSTTPSTPPASTGASATAPPGSTAGSPALKPIDPAALQSTVDTTARELLVPGAVVILRTPQGEFTVTSGTTMLGATIPPRADTHFRIASNTKTMTAAVIVQLAQEGKLSLGDPVSKYVPSVPNGDKITIAELLKMRSGLYNYTAAPEFSASLDRDPTRVWTPDEVLAIAYKHPPLFPPGTAYQYNNTNYALLGLVAEKLDGKPLARALQDRLFGPLSLKDTLLPPSTSNTLPDPYSHGYMYGGTAFALVDKSYPPKIQAAARAGSIRPNDYTGQNPSYASAAGGVISTANDLATWFQALVGGRVLNADYQRQWLDSVQPEDPSKPDGQQYGYGIAQTRFGPNTLYFHGGEMPGFNSFMGYDPTNKVTLVVWTNLTVSLDGLPTANTLMLKLLDRIYVESPAPPRPSPTATPPRRGGARRH